MHVCFVDTAHGSTPRFHMKIAHEHLFPTRLSVCVQMAAIGGRHLASVTRCKTAKAVVKPLIEH